jgi:Leucine-rich repeat (LRR) protein
LWDLDLAQTQLTGSLNGLPTSLRRLWLANTQFNESGGVIGLTSLSSLNLANMDLTGTIPSTIGKMTSLKYVNLAYNRLVRSAEVLALINMKHVAVRFGRFGTNIFAVKSGSLPSELALITDMDYLDLTGNQLAGSLFSELGMMTNLQELLLEDNQISQSIPTELGTAGNIVNLNLAFNAISGVIPTELGNMGLEHLKIARNRLSGSLPSQLGRIQSLITLG